MKQQIQEIINKRIELILNKEKTDINEIGKKQFVYSFDKETNKLINNIVDNIKPSVCGDILFRELVSKESIYKLDTIGIIEDYYGNLKPLSDISFGERKIEVIKRRIKKMKNNSIKNIYQYDKLENIFIKNKQYIDSLLDVPKQGMIKDMKLFYEEVVKNPSISKKEKFNLLSMFNNYINDNIAKVVFYVSSMFYNELKYLIDDDLIIRNEKGTISKFFGKLTKENLFGKISSTEGTLTVSELSNRMGLNWSITFYEISFNLYFNLFIGKLLFYVNVLAEIVGDKSYLVGLLLVNELISQRHYNYHVPSVDFNEDGFLFYTKHIQNYLEANTTLCIKYLYSHAGPKNEYYKVNMNAFNMKDSFINNIVLKFYVFVSKYILKNIKYKLLEAISDYAINSGNIEFYHGMNTIFNKIVYDYKGFNRLEFNRISGNKQFLKRVLEQDTIFSKIKDKLLEYKGDKLGLTLYKNIYKSTKSKITSIIGIMFTNFYISNWGNQNIEDVNIVIDGELKEYVVSSINDGDGGEVSSDELLTKISGLEEIASEQKHGIILHTTEALIQNIFDRHLNQVYKNLEYIKNIVYTLFISAVENGKENFNQIIEEGYIGNVNIKDKKLFEELFASVLSSIEDTITLFVDKNQLIDINGYKKYFEKVYNCIKESSEESYEGKLESLVYLYNNLLLGIYKLLKDNYTKLFLDNIDGKDMNFDLYIKYTYNIIKEEVDLLLGGELGFKEELDGLIKKFFDLSLEKEMEEFIQGIHYTDKIEKLY